MNKRGFVRIENGEFSKTEKMYMETLGGKITLLSTKNDSHILGKKQNFGFFDLITKEYDPVNLRNIISKCEDLSEIQSTKVDFSYEEEKHPYLIIRSSCKPFRKTHKFEYIFEKFFYNNLNYESTQLFKKMNDDCNKLEELKYFCLLIINNLLTDYLRNDIIQMTDLKFILNCKGKYDLITLQLSDGIINLFKLDDLIHYFIKRKENSYENKGLKVLFYLKNSEIVFHFLNSERKSGHKRSRGDDDDENEYERKLKRQKSQ